MDKHHHSNSGQQRRAGNLQICRLFSQPGGCRFGSKCKFLHINPADQQANVEYDKNIHQSEASSNGKHRQNTGRERFIQWRYDVPLDVIGAPPLGTRRTQFFQTALELIDTDVGTMQDTVKSLTSEGGLSRIKELLDQNLELSDFEGQNVLINQLLPFFRILTHSDVAASILLEEKIGSLYNILYGRQGERGIKVFTFIVRVLASLEISEKNSVPVMAPILAVFSSMLDMNSHALANEELPPLAEILIEIRNGCDPDTRLHLQKIVTNISRRLKVGLSLQQSKTKVKMHQPKVTFVLPRDPPGHLSSHGPRHDNDHANIKDIKIMPTSQEIQASRPPYLPPYDSRQLHIPGLSGLLDRHFRLLREDTIGQLTDAIGAEMSQDKLSRKNASRTNTYDNLYVSGVNFSRWKGLQLLVEFDQPQNLQELSSAARKEWWEHTNRLKSDALVCIIDQQNSVTFCTVTDLSHASGAKSEDTKQDPGKNKNMYQDSLRCHLQLQLVSPDGLTVSKFLDQSGRELLNQKLVEFPGVILPSFLPTLEALQKMSLRNDLPFAEVLAPDEDFAMPDEDHSRPIYASRPGFRFDLQDVTINKSPLAYTVGQNFDMNYFKSISQLDDAQAEALIHCLHHSFALIQGPPGTGKSFTGVQLIKVLLAIKKKASLGPIVCVCYTNHALDQLLEHLVRHDVGQIIRIGSRSKSQVLDNCNLRTVAKDMTLTGPEKRERWEAAQTLHAEEAEIEDIIDSLSKVSSKSVIKEYLNRYHPHHFIQLFDTGQDGDGFRTVRHQDNKIRAWLSGRYGSIATDERARQFQDLRYANLLEMTSGERQALYQYWLNDIRQTLHDKLARSIESHKIAKSQLDRIQQGLDLRCLEAANIIGVTTTGLARQLDLLRNLRSKVLVCEEAGEVLEAHILTALLPSLEHVILIGDHLQLPPHIQNFDLSRENSRGKQYSLDVSLFERLVKPYDIARALPLSVLETQRRMHPSISQLIRSTLYPQLKDSPHVHTYPEVAGMKKRLFWFDHREPEAGSDSTQLATTSHTNEFEVGMIVALVTHLVRQGVYAANEIAVLTPYLGQLHKIRKVFRNQFEITMNERDIQELERQGIEDDSDFEAGTRAPVVKTALLKALSISTIDNFQGEEAKVVVISLVRSNPQNKCGFLKTSNRINVLLSRAQHGMYIIGNSETSSHVPMWAGVIAMLNEGDNFGSKLQLECPRHPDSPILVKNPDDFVVFSPEGGCDKKCDKRLDCGHRDPSKCHSETLHKAVKCSESCPRRLKGCDHDCPNSCGDRCITQCQVQLTGLNVMLECGHTKTTLPCWQNQDPSIIKCCSVVEKIIPGCKHKVQLPCHVDTMSKFFECPERCGTELICGHKCKKQCDQCTRQKDGVIVAQDHGQCNQVCGRKFNSCSHYCQLTCHGNSPCKCSSACTNFCDHSHCGKKCEEPCAPCASTTCTTGRCPHTKPCSMPCAAPCDWLPCAKRCEKILTCGHQCPTVCGEICPSPKYCQICAEEGVRDMVVDFVMLSTYGEIDLDEEPCVIPSCGHILAISSMDGQMDMSKHYVMDGNTAISIKNNSEPFSMDELKVCGTCRGSLRNINRYGRIVRRAILDESTKKFTRWAGLGTIKLTEELYKEQQNLEESRDKARFAKAISESEVFLRGPPGQQMKIVSKMSGRRYNRMRGIQSRITQHLTKVKVEEQPYKRVWDLVQFAKRNNNDVGEMRFDTDVLQTRETVQVTSLSLKCNLMILSDFIQIMQHDTTLKVDFSHNRNSCQELVQLALDANQPLHAVEGHLFVAQYCAAEQQHAAGEDSSVSSETARVHVEAARAICEKYPRATARMRSELADVENMLRLTTFYSPMRDAEWTQVMQAMVLEFSGTGHWYRCENGHPFTVGECGMPMQLARCPQCDAPIGGQSHRPADGVSRANDLEQTFGRMRLQ